MRMQMRRFTRPTSAFSKKLEHHVAMAALYFFYYNFCRVHQTLRARAHITYAELAEHLNNLRAIMEKLEIYLNLRFTPRLTRLGQKVSSQKGRIFKLMS
jgi:hypothetical protein